jgi:hypothetical protein
MNKSRCRCRCSSRPLNSGLGLVARLEKGVSCRCDRVVENSGVDAGNFEDSSVAFPVIEEKMGLKDAFAERGDKGDGREGM